MSAIRQMPGNLFAVFGGVTGSMFRKRSAPAHWSEQVRENRLESHHAATSRRRAFAGTRDSSRTDYPQSAGRLLLINKRDVFRARHRQIHSVRHEIRDGRGNCLLKKGREIAICRMMTIMGIRAAWYVIHPGPDFFRKHTALNFDCRRRGLAGRRIFPRAGCFSSCSSTFFQSSRICGKAALQFASRSHSPNSRSIARAADSEWCNGIFRSVGATASRIALRTCSGCRRNKPAPREFVRPPEKIDPVIAEPCSDIVEIIHRDGRCIFCQVHAFLELVTHFLDVIDWIHLAQVVARRFLTARIARRFDSPVPR